MKALKINVNGRMKIVDITGETIEEQNQSIYKYLGGYFDIVRIGNDAVMLVDDNGLLKNLRPNTMAEMIAERSLLVGTALIVGIMPTDDGEVFTDCPERYIRFRDTINMIYGKEKPHH